jgi:hypothetical protein
MFDDFRQQADDAQFEETPEEALETANTTFATTQVVLRPSPARRILGMTAPQRFVIAILVMFEVCMLGIMFLLVAQKIVPPVFY